MDEKLTVMAVGGAGCRIMAKLNSIPESAGLRLVAVDTDRQSLIDSTLPEQNTLLAAESWRGGKGCGGRVLDGQSAIANARSGIDAFLKDCQMLVIIGGLGGGTASGGIPIILREAGKLHIPTFCILSLPFSMESISKSMAAEKALNENIFPAADAVVTLPNDLLFSMLPAETPVSESFALADSELARTVLALTGLLTSGNLFNSNFSDLCAVLNGRKNRCAIGIGVVKGDLPNRLDAAMSELLHSPLLGGADFLNEADAVVFTVLGGPELSLGEAKAAIETSKNFIADDARLITGAATSPAWAGLLQLSVLAIKFDERDNARSLLDIPGEESDIEAGNADPGVQLVFGFDSMEKGIMEGTCQVNFNGEDLDIPTFKRKNLIISGVKTARRDI